MKICIIGQGYIGIPTAALFAKSGYYTVGVDTNLKKVKSLNNGLVPIEEEGIQEIINSVIHTGHYKASTTPEEADAYIITVPTPYIKENYSCDLSYVIAACESILPYIKKGNTVIIESTIAPLSTNDVIKPLFEKEGFKIGETLYLVHCPERVLPGHILDELVNNNRIIGGITSECSKKATNIYKIFVKGEIIQTEAKVAELSKCMENTFRDVNIALANELAKIGNQIDVNALDVIKLANKHPRVNIHTPGPGVGGHCLAIDPYFIYSKAPESAKIIKLARTVNESMPDFVITKTKELFNTFSLTNPKIAILGVAYKGNTGDDRESPAYKIIEGLKDYEITIHDPHVLNNNFSSLENTLKQASIAIILVDHDEFKNLDYNLMINSMNKSIIFDTKNIIKKETIPEEITLINFGNLYDYLQ